MSFFRGLFKAMLLPVVLVATLTGQVITPVNADLQVYDPKGEVGLSRFVGGLLFQHHTGIDYFLPETVLATQNFENALTAVYPNDSKVRQLWEDYVHGFQNEPGVFPKIPIPAGAERGVSPADWKLLMDAKRRLENNILKIQFPERYNDAALPPA